MNKKSFVFILVGFIILTNPSAQSGAGYELALTAFAASAANVQQNQLFTVTATPRNVGIEQFPGGQVGAALVDNSGRIVAVIGSANRNALNVRATGNTLTINSFVPETVRAGQYQLMAVVRPTDGEWRVVTQTLQNVSSAINLTVTAESGTAGGGYGMALAVFSASVSRIQHYESFTVTATPRNVGLAQFPGGQIGAALVDSSGRIAAVVGTRNRGTLNAGSLSGAIEFNCTVPHTVNPGRYQLRAVIRPNGGQWRLATLAMPNIPNSIDFEVRVNPSIIVPPLLQIKWNQDSPYNDLFPYLPNHVKANSGNGRLVTDCGTTAAIQIMAFYRHPVRAVGTSTVLGPHGINVPLVNFNSYTFDWANMRNTYTAGDPGTAQERRAVAELNFIFGMARGNGIGFTRIFIENFGYDRSIQWHERRFYTDAEWGALIRQQLDAGLPLWYYGNSPAGDHASVIDGYDNTGRFHINWGWNGNRDGFYTFDEFPPQGSQLPNRDNRLISYVYINFIPDRGSTGSNEFALNGFTTGSTSVSINARFTVTPVLFSIGCFPGGQAGIALVGNNNNIVAVIGSRNLGNNWLSGSRSAMEMNCTVPGTVNAGQYRLMAVTRIEGGEWKLVTLTDKVAGVPNSINITVTGSGSAASQPVIQPTAQPTVQQPTTQQSTTQQSTAQQPAAQQTLAANAPATVTINNGQRMQLSFTAPSAGTYIIESTNNGTLDPVAYSAASGSGSAVNIDDDSGEGRNFQFARDLRAGETITFFAGVHSDRGSGSYSINIQAVQSVTLSANALSTVTINNGQRVQLNFTAPSTGAYTFESSNNGTLDPVAFSAASGTGSAATINDDSGQGRNFRFTRNLNAGEVFTFFAGLHGNRGSGSYTVNVQSGR